MRVLVCGGRDFDDIALVYECLRELHPTVVIHGGCPTGADFFADRWADPIVPREVYKADWSKYGRGAGPRRNQKMIDEGKPDVVLAFPGGRGTADTVRRAQKAGLKIIDPCEALCEPRGALRLREPPSGSRHLESVTWYLTGKSFEGWVHEHQQILIGEKRA